MTWKGPGAKIKCNCQRENTISQKTYSTEFILAKKLTLILKVQGQMIFRVLGFGMQE